MLIDYTYTCKEIYEYLYTSPYKYADTIVYIDGLSHTPLELINLGRMKVRLYDIKSEDNYTNYMFTLLKGGE